MFVDAQPHQPPSTFYGFPQLLLFFSNILHCISSSLVRKGDMLYDPGPKLTVETSEISALLMYF